MLNGYALLQSVEDALVSDEAGLRHLLMLLERGDDQLDDLLTRSCVNVSANAHHDDLYEATKDELHIHGLSCALTWVINRLL